MKQSHIVEKHALTTKEAAAYTGLAESTLRQGRLMKERANRIKTPPYVQDGKFVRYLKPDLDAWLLARKVRR
jgi:predicted DNA-binding transcriptional regulator AlpA